MSRARTTRVSWPWVGLVVLVVVTAILVWMAVMKYRTQSIPTIGWLVPANAQASPSFTVTPAGSTPTPTAAPTPTVRRAGLAGIADIVNSPDGASIMVIGDGSGDEYDEWVTAWVSDHLATAASVSYNDWSRTGGRYADPVRSGSGTREVTLWNASADFPTMSGEPERIAQAWRDADVVLLNYGHRRSADEIATQLDAVLAAVRAQSADVPVAVLLQNPERAATRAAHQQTVGAIRTWAAAKELPTIDVNAAFKDAPGPVDDLVDWAGSPTPQGATLWATTLAQALAG